MGGRAAVDDVVDGDDGGRGGGEQDPQERGGVENQHVHGQRIAVGALPGRP